MLLRLQLVVRILAPIDDASLIVLHLGSLKTEVLHQRLGELSALLSAVAVDDDLGVLDDPGLLQGLRGPLRLQVRSSS